MINGSPLLEVRGLTKPSVAWLPRNDVSFLGDGAGRWSR